MTDAQAEQAKDVIRRFVEEVQNQKNWDVYDALNDPESSTTALRWG